MVSPVLTLVMSIFDIYLFIVILRLWLQLAKADFYNPFSQFTVKATQPVVGPLRRFVPSIGPIDTATLLFIMLIAFAKIVTYALIAQVGFPPLLSAFIFSILNLIYKVMWLIFIILIIRAILSWVSQGNHPVEMVMGQLTEPLLRPIRRILPPMGGLDLSVLIFLLGLQFIINVFSNSFGPFV
jgi:YggT family protein